MCRLLAYASPNQVRISDVIGSEQCARFQAMGRLHDDGWGSMWVEHGDGPPHLARLRDATRADEDARLAEAMRHPRSNARAFHLRMATGSLPVATANTHPFLAEGIGLAHNGSIIPTAALREMLRPDVLDGVEGSTDSELYLALVLQFSRDGLPLADAVQAALTRIRESYPQASLNAIVMSVDTLVAVHSSSAAGVPWQEFAASGLGPHEFPTGHDESYYRMGCRVGADGSIAFSSTGLDAAGWAPLPPDSLTSVDLATMTVTTTHLGEASAVA